MNLVTPASSYRPSQGSPKDSVRLLLTPIRFLKGVGPKRAAQLESLGIRTVEDLLYHLPFRYEDRRKIKRIADAVLGTEQAIIGKLVGLEKRYVPKWRRSILVGKLTDGTGSLDLVWYRAVSYLTKSLAKGCGLLVYGKVEKGMGPQKRMVHPEFEIIDDGEEAGDHERILPIYVRPGGVPLGALRRWLDQALAQYGSCLPSFLPSSIARRRGLIDLCRSMGQVHRPDKTADLSALNQFASSAHRSIIFDEFFYLQLGLGLRRKGRTAQAGIGFRPKHGGLTEAMRGLLPFRLTRAQERVLEEIYKDMESCRPMQRLVQGDVGSGKTMVAWLASLRAIENGYQAVWMAPTELLAEQHFRNLKGYAARLGLTAVVLTGSLAEKSKSEALSWIEGGEAGFIVGTHALVQEGVRAPNMGLGVIDEQHRFGVVQRMALKRLAHWRSGSGPGLAEPDILLMSATPIPRSMAMVLYGDMEVSSLDEVPPGRTPVKTLLFSEKERSKPYEIVRQEVQKGHQAYVVYPLVEPSERLHLRDATRMAGELSNGVFEGFSLGLIHGRMAGDERERVMRRFKDGEIQILVATTVIEVGIDVPNATVMLVEHAERFGLSQLHQLRGRVGRGKAASQCFLVHYDLGSAEALRRLKVMEKEQDGFKIAEADLMMRGPGELLGTRQSGLPDFRLANLIRDSRLLLEARKEALDWLARDPSLKLPESVKLRAILKYRWGGRLELGGVG